MSMMINVMYRVPEEQENKALDAFLQEGLKAHVELHSDQERAVAIEQITKKENPDPEDFNILSRRAELILQGKGIEFDYIGCGRSALD